MMVIPREVEITATNSREIRSLRESISLSIVQKEILIGSILGDGALVVNAWKKNYRLRIEHGEKQKDYLFWKAQAFKNFILSDSKFRVVNNSWYFQTISHKDFLFFRHTFYPNNKKVIPSNIDSLLISPISLAVWYMDDGSLSSRKDACIINTQSFSLADNILLQNCLLKNFGIQTTLHKDKQYIRLYIGRFVSKKFINLIKDYVIESMQYKLTLTP